jgi:hypothetical protein
VSDLRVVYEIQSRLRQDQENLQIVPQDNAPQPAPEKRPGPNNDHTRVQPKQQNRANESARQMQSFAAEGPLMFYRSIR